MTTAADDSAVEDAFEALLAGRPAPHGAAALTAFTGAVRATATSPGRPNAALADLLATGLLIDQSSPSAQTARSAGTPRGSRNRIRRRTAMFFPAILAKLLSAGALAQAATGATVVVVAVTGAGAAGVLPDPMQETFTSIVSDEVPVLAERAAPIEGAPDQAIPLDEQTPPAPVAGESVDETLDEAPAVETVEDWMSAPIDGSFGDWVNLARNNPMLQEDIAESGHNFGYFVSCRAHNKGMAEDDVADAGVTLDEPAESCAVVEETPEAEAPEDEVVTTQQTTEDSSNHGNGNGRGNGGGRSNGNGNGRD